MKAIDLTGRKFGRLTVIERDYSKTNGTYWLCKCDYENKELKSVKASYLKDNKILSCGCLRLERQRKSHKKHNVYDMSNDYGIGSTENGDEFYFDKEDYEKIKDYYWYLNKDGYVISTPFHNSKTILMHRLVMDVSDSKVLVDHIYHHKNDNRKQFLRIVTKSQNAMNSLTPINNSSGQKGVYLYKRTQKWIAGLWINNKYISCGSYNLKEDAIKARLAAEKVYYGEYSCEEDKCAK